LISLFSLVLITSLSGGVLLAKKTEITYPEIFKDIIPPSTTRALLPEYVKYVFGVAVAVSGLIVFGALVYGGIRYVTSAGNPSSLNDAKDRIFAALFGLAVILGSYLLLKSLNPQLIILRASLEIKQGVILYKDGGCGGEQREVAANIPDLGDWNDKVGSLKFAEGSQGVVDVDIFAEINYCLDEKGIPKTGCEFRRLESDEEEKDKCFSVGGAAKSLRFSWKLPGVYLINDKGEEKYLAGDAATLGDFNDKVKKVRFQNIEGVVNYGVVLHEHENGKGGCRVYISKDSISATPTWMTVINDNKPVEVASLGNGVSSATIFISTKKASGKGVTFYEHSDFGGKSWGPIKDVDGRTGANVGNVKDATNGVMPNDAITSLKIDLENKYLAVLFDEANAGNYPASAGTCQVFTRSDSNLRNDPIGRCHCGPRSWGCGDCLSSFIIVPIE